MDNKFSTNDYLGGVDFNLIAHLQGHIKLHTQEVALAFLCILAYGLHVLYLLIKAKNFILEFIS